MPLSTVKACVFWQRAQKGQCDRLLQGSKECARCQHAGLLFYKELGQWLRADCDCNLKQMLRKTQEVPFGPSSGCHLTKLTENEAKWGCFKWMTVSYLAKRTPPWSFCRRYLPAHLKDACSHPRQGRWCVLSCPLSSLALGAGAGIQLHWWEVPQVGVWRLIPAFCPGVGGLEPQAQGCHPAKPRGEETL